MNTKLPRTARLGAAFSTALLLSGLSASGSTILYEGFDIEPGEIDNTAGATSFGWAGGDSPLPWFSWEEDTGDLYHGVSETGLTWPNLPTVGGAFEFHDEPLEATMITERTMLNSYGYAGSGQLWMSALFQASIEGNPDDGGFFQLVLTTQGSSDTNRVYMGIANNEETENWSAGGERLYVLGTDGDKWGPSSERVVEGETAFLVMHFDFDAKIASFYANPDATATDPGEPAVEFEILSDFYVESVKMWIYNAASTESAGADYTGSLIDEIRLGDTYADVAAGAQTIDPVDPGPEEPEPIDEALAFFELDEDAEGDFWLNAEGLGWVHAESYPWFYSYSELGWIYSYETSENFTAGSWFWDLNRNNWIHTNAVDYPWVFAHGEGWVDSSAEAEE